MDEARAESQADRDAEERFIQEESELTPAEHWQAIKDLMDTIAIQVKDLEENTRKLKEDAFYIFPKV